jgi:hypothetical protein
LFQETPYQGSYAVHVFDLALPHNKAIPSEQPQSLLILSITALVPLQFREPILLARFWNPRIAARTMLMPKATMDEYPLPFLGENEIRLAWKFSDVEAVTESHLVN